MKANMPIQHLERISISFSGQLDMLLETPDEVII